MSGVREIAFSNAIGRPKNGPDKSRSRARKGPRYAGLGGFSAQSGRLGARDWRVGRSSKVQGSQDWTPVSGLTLILAVACRYNAQRHPGCRVTAARGDSCSTGKRLKQRSAAPPRAPYPWAAAADRAPGGQGSSRSPGHRSLKDGGDDLELTASLLELRLLWSRQIAKSNVRTQP